MQPLLFPNWKWKFISLDFITGLPKNQKQNDSKMVVVDKLIKVAHFIHVKTTHKGASIVDTFMKEIFRLHEILKVMISDRDPKFTDNF